MTRFEELKSLKTNEDAALWLEDYCVDFYGDPPDINEILDFLNEEIKGTNESFLTKEVPDMKMAQRRKDDRRHKRKAERIWRYNSGRYHPFGYYPVDKNGDYTNDKDEIAYYKRTSWSSGVRKWLKRRSNKKIRSSNPEELYSGGQYRRLFEYWWELY